MTAMMSSPSAVRLGPAKGRITADSIEGPSSFPRMVVLILHRPLAQACLLGMLLACGLRLVGGLCGMTVGPGQLVMMAGAVVATFWYMRVSLDVGFWVALPGALVWLCHPLCAGSIEDGSAGATLLPMLAVPLVLAAAGGIGRQAGIRTGVLLGVVLGAPLAIMGRGGLVLVGTAIVVAGYETFAVAGPQRSRRHWRASAISLLFAAVVAASVALTLPSVASRLGTALPAPETAAAETGVVTAPFAWVDRAGLLASRLTVLPEDLRAGGGTYYLGGALLVLGLIAVWPKTADQRCRRAALSIVLAFIALWLVRGSESLHAQLWRMFEFATLKRHVEPATLQLLGIMTIPLAVLPLTLFLATGRLVRSGRRWTFAAVIVATGTVMVWWAGTPNGVLPRSVAEFCASLNSPLSRVLIAFLIVGGAAVGLERLQIIAPTRPRRLLVWLIASVLLAADVHPYTLAAMDRHSPGRIPGSSQAVPQKGTG